MSLILHGKVREVHDVGGDRLIILTSDRISAYDAILPTPIPGKGQILTGLSAHWFSRTRDIVPNHMLATSLAELPPPWNGPEFAGRVMLVRRLEMLPVECVVRGYLAGSGWRDYQEHGSVGGHHLPRKLALAERLPQPLFTPAHKATDGHDENITLGQSAELIGLEITQELERISISLYERAAAECLASGIILADTKFEIGRDESGTLVLADEVVTPDSSRFWPAADYAVGANPPSFDKQYVRDWLDASGWDHTPPAPALPEDVVDGTRNRYREAYRQITGREINNWIQENQ